MNTTINTVTLPGYHLGEQLYSGSRTVVYRGTRLVDDQAVVVKLLQQEYPTFHDLLQFRNQHTIMLRIADANAKNLDIPGIIRPYSLETYRNSYALVMEDLGSVSLRKYTCDRTLDLVQVLEIAVQLADILHNLHASRVIHKDIKPANILIHPDTKEVKLIDFSIASLLPKETQEIKNPNGLEGTLAYLAPEQTGRMNRGIDYRSDFYALGVTLFELLAGKLPFESDDPMELVHCHIAKQPPSLTQFNISETVASMIAKLMAKNAEDRYQSALGLKYDLEICLNQLKEKGEIEAFEIGQRDLCDRFIIPEKLYGRETEVQTLLAAFERVSQGTSEMMLMAGFSGIGKTAVINEVHKPITRQRGYFIKGKFDQFNRNIPFSAFVQAFRNLIGQLLAESDVQLHHWKTQILAALGENGQVLIEVIPELEQIIGQQPPAPELSGNAAQNRFNLLFGNFIKVFADREHPLVMFIDDLQWADSASLSLLKLLMQDNKYLLILGAYRDNEVFPAHPLMLAIDEIGKTGATINTITLQPLELADLNELVADTLSCDRPLAQPLTDLVFQKTKGNPFFATQFLKALYEEKQIRFDRQIRHWQCDITQIKALALTDDVVEFMALQLQKLPIATQNILKLAACIGAQFDLNTLAIVAEQSSENAAMALWKALQEELIIPNTEIYKFFMEAGSVEVADTVANPTYRFLHDRVQQAAYSLIPDEQKQATHYQIGQLLLQQISPVAREERIFELVNQLNYGTALITSQTERAELAQLNLIACRKAKTATAYQAGRDYARTGLSLLAKNNWQQHYEMTLLFHNDAAELAMLCGDFEAMEQLIETVIDRAHSLLEKIDVYCIRIQANVARTKLTEALALGIQILQQLGVTMTESPTPADIQQLIQEISNLIRDRKIEDFVHLPVMTDANTIAIVQIASSILPAAYICGSLLNPLLISLSVKLSLQHGNMAISALNYACYSLVVCNFLQDVELAVQFSQLALNVVSKLDAKATKPEVLMLLGTFILHRKSHIKETLPLLSESYTIALEVGNLLCVGYSGHYFGLNAFWCGQRLANVEQDTRNYYNGLVQVNQLISANYCRIYWQSILNLLGCAEHPTILSGLALQETEFLPLLRSANDIFWLYIFYLYKLTLCFLFGEIELANHHALECRNYLMTAAGTVGEPALYFYDSLIALALLNQPSAEESEALERVAENQTKLQHWAHHAPMNYQHKLDLVEAEKCRVLGQKAKAIEFYDKAISGAKANEYIQEEALANELAAKFYLAWGKEKVAAGYMQEAYYCYAKWGAKAKIDDLEQRYRDLLRPILQQPAPTLNPLETLARLTNPTLSLHSTTKTSLSSSSRIDTALDFATIIKASQALSGTIQIDELLHQLTRMILQHSGGDRCALILPDNDGIWQVRAIATPKVTEICATPLESNPHLPTKLIHYVKNAQEVVVIDDLKTDLPVVCEYLHHQHPKSVLCLPILNQGNLIGIVYLENSSTSGAFASDRILILNFLCTQAAISLENARLYHQLQDYAQQLEQSQLQLVQSEKMSALGNLVAGVAHEINNPVGCIVGNVGAAQDYINDLLGIIDLYQEELPQPSAKIEEELEAIDLEYVREDLPKLIKAMKDGGDRIKSISNSLRTFSRADSDIPQKFNLHEGIDSTILILRHRLKANEQRPAIEVATDYGNLPEIACFPGQLNQVFMNILANAIDALDESNSGRTFADIQANLNRITIRTSVATEEVKIAIADNGSGIPESVKTRIFDHLFTTKAVGKGTGLGLAIARQIIVEKHGGKIDVNSEIGKGTEFVLTLPIC